MPDEQKVFTVIGAAAAITIIALLYGTISIQAAEAKIEARDLVVSSMGAKGDTNPVKSQPTPEPAEITLTLIVSSPHKNIASLLSLLLQLKQLPDIKVIGEKTLEKDSGEAKQLIEKYSIERIPAMLLEGETKKAATLSQNWPKIGSVESDGTMVLRNIPPVYLETSTGKLRGEINAAFISVPDKNGVFDANEVFTQILQNAFGIRPISQETLRYDSPRGKELVSKYGLEKLPTFIISGDLNAYSGFPESWKEIGSVEPDNSFVFRELGAIGGIKYLDLNKNEVVETLRQQ
ncbi:MAG: hypothetical protein HY544_02105 [Candidatus Diapherotrites archaeon]|uniref:Uncharacterized protein n=1 Tax=Candidatus Iainarchaeum sp. TaxID=3101447 RepID=A0A8T3YMJ5_9ARCH|nr:hypothetical protein [Candidatus Diapherotrites archaeon]